MKFNPEKPQVQEQKNISPSLEGELDQRFRLFIEPHSLPGESFKMLRAKIFTKDSGSAPKSIIVTSPEPMDGKAPKDLILEAVENLGCVKTLGIVFNAAKETPKEYDYYYRYYRQEPRWF